MLKIGIIGLGDIAKKAYLPVITRQSVDIHLFTRNKATVREVASQYNLTNIHDSLDSLISSGIEAAFVHASTQAHFEIIRQLLDHNIHVYVDKPVTDSYDSTVSLFEIANQKKLILFTGFNRRFAPAYVNVRQREGTSMIILQKNRKALPGPARSFVFDDFIHVIDTLRFLTPWEFTDVIIRGLKKGNLVHHVMIQLNSRHGEQAIGIMNRDAGANEERLEVFTGGGKWVVENVSDTIHLQDRNRTVVGQDDWTPTLRKRGFEQVISSFLEQIRGGQMSADMNDSLETHRLCEEVVQYLEKI